MSETIPVSECRHEEVYFGSGDYYVFCRGCGSRWGRVGMQREYGVSMGGEQIGCMPELSNKGPAMGNSDVRVNPVHAHATGKREGMEEAARMAEERAALCHFTIVQEWLKDFAIDIRESIRRSSEAQNG